MARTLSQEAVVQWRRCLRLFCLLVESLLHWSRKGSSSVLQTAVDNEAECFQPKLMQGDGSYVTVEIKEAQRHSPVCERKHVSRTRCTKEFYVELSPNLTIEQTLFLNRKLLILDINGVLADILCHTPKGYKCDKRISRQGVFVRPYCHDFLKFCFSRYNVGIWSSRSKKNVEPIVNYLMGDLKHMLLFGWDLSHCTMTNFRTPENRHKPLVLKELRKIWESSEFIWDEGYYNETNTLLLDDSPNKALLNPLHTSVFPHPYHFQDTNDNSLGHGGDLRVFLEELSGADNVQKYVEKHPFGQQAIDESSTLWSFYVKVMEPFTSSRSINFSSSSN